MIPRRFSGQVFLGDLGACDRPEVADPAHLVDVDPEVGAGAHQAIGVGRREAVSVISQSIRWIVAVSTA